MKDKLIVILAVVLVVALAAQAYTLFQLSGRVDQLSPQGNKVSARLSKFSNFGYIFVSGLWI